MRTYSGAASLRIGYFWPRISISTRCFSAIGVPTPNPALSPEGGGTKGLLDVQPGELRGVAGHRGPPIRALGIDLLTRTTLFDVYTGGQVGAGRRSLAWSLTFQAPDRTLTDAEVNRLHERIVAEIAKRFRAEVRGA
jgi:hypothetical protein